MAGPPLAAKAAAKITSQGRLPVSEELFMITRDALKDGKLTSLADAPRWLRRLPAHLQHEAAQHALRRVAGVVRTGYATSATYERMNARHNAVVNASRRQKERAFDRIVEMLDHKLVGDKKLGDCRRTDLLRAAALLEQEAGEMTLDAALYRQLVGVIGDGTVRAAAGLGKIQGLLTSRWGEDVAA